MALGIEGTDLSRTVDCIEHCGEAVRIVNEGLNQMWESESPLTCSYCGKHHPFLGEFIIDDESVLHCFAARCHEKFLRQIKFAKDDDFFLGRGFNCKAVTTKTRKIVRREVTHKVRWQVLKRDKFRCVACGGTEGGLEIDHKVPVSKGGDSSLGNLQTLCKTCNSGKSDSQ